MGLAMDPTLDFLPNKYMYIVQVDYNYLVQILILVHISIANTIDQLNSDENVFYYFDMDQIQIVEF